jgi:rhamnogalacturonyl hydrolase YesR
MASIPRSYSTHHTMKPTFPRRLLKRTALLFTASGCLAAAWTFFAADAATAAISPEVTPAAVLSTMESVADWQLANPSTHLTTDWTQGAGDAGFMALAGISADPKYGAAMLAACESNEWQLGPIMYDADNYCIGQTYAELYLLHRERGMIAPLRERFDAILAKPTDVQSMNYAQAASRVRENWSWCDALFMGPPAWVRLYAATGDERYLDFAVTNWWRTTDFLYDKDAHLFYRDSTYLNRHEPNGEKVFWSRGNGWVMAGLVRVLQFLPMNHPDRPRFEGLFKEMAAKLLTCQQPDGLWHSSLLDPADYTIKETSGSGFYTYAFAWGVNQGLLDREQFEPAIRKAWAALVDCVDANGRLTHVQPIGSDPRRFNTNATEIYGVGGFLLAGSEVYRMAVLEKAKPVMVRVTNPSAFRRDCETVEIDLGNAAAGAPWPEKPAVMDGVSSRILDSQVYASEPGGQTDRLLFQVDLAPGETRKFCVLAASELAAVPPPIVKTAARFVPERDDDFTWESDRIAHRTYGLALIKAEGTISSGPDVWIKKNRDLVADTMYRTGHYHQDNGAFMDDYRVGNSRGDGGTGIWDGKKLHVSSNYRNWRLITTGPVRSVFELTYDAWDAGGGRMVSETKRYSIDAGSWFTKAQSTFASEDPSPLTVAVGLAERACGPDGTELISQDQAEGWMAYWQPEDKPKGTMGVAVILPKDSVLEFTNDNADLPDSKVHAVVPQPTVEGAPPIRNLLAVTQVEPGRPLTYYFGACWDRSGDFTNQVSWENHVRQVAARRDEPLQVSFERK